MAPSCGKGKGKIDQKQKKNEKPAGRAAILKHKEDMFEDSIERQTPGLVAEPHNDEQDTLEGAEETTSPGVENQDSSRPERKVGQRVTPYQRYVASCRAYGYDPETLEKQRAERSAKASKRPTDG
ncbi:hypothetical protein BDZ85DRAFT_282753 [Elsinoe ampelina]|uniref:Uncharacterized protein n=1 Tax=Elsinoe ampelina TaxID=302913 RepID=A0A6A6GAD2_9PEZI|nr:hypothetical protein BDZ85DRAFT_282753 [Elsinoe ampelina]